MMWSHVYQKKPPERALLAHIRNDTLRSVPVSIGWVRVLRAVGTAPAMSSAMMRPPPELAVKSSRPSCIDQRERLCAPCTVKSSGLEKSQGSENSTVA